MASFRKKHLKDKINKMRPKKPLYKKAWFWIIFFILVLIFLIIYLVFFLNEIQIKNVSIAGNKKISTSQIENKINNIISKKVVSIGSWNLISKSFFLVNKKEINNNLLDEFPVIKAIRVVKKFPNNIDINITEKDPLGAYCDDNDCFLIDQNGVIFERLDNLSNETFIIKQTDVNKLLNAGDVIVSERRIKAISKISDVLREGFQINLRNAVINNSSRLNIITNEGWKIYFDLSDSANIDNQIKKLDSLLGVGLSGGEGEGDRKNLRYIDLRPNDRAIVCDNDICGNSY